MHKLFFDKAYLQGIWTDNVQISVDELGVITRIDTSVPKSTGAQAYHGLAVPGMSNLHSHAFQRAMAGMTEYAGNSKDSFWTWREKMYKFAGSIEPHHLSAIASQLYVEMLKAGFTSVGEFHYLHHDKDGNRFSDPAEMSWSIFDASEKAGIRLTHLPVFYNSSGFGQHETNDGQARFSNSTESYLELYEKIKQKSSEHQAINVGIAPHSLRAVPIDKLKEIKQAVGPDCPVHIHIAEQLAEVDDCVAFSGKRPVEYLYDNIEIDDHWCLVHATHLTSSEFSSIARSGSVVGLCPITEANLGDGVFPAEAFLAEGGQLGIGSDSNVYVSLAEELRLLEYGQRLTSHQRNVLAQSENSTGETLFNTASRGGALALRHDKKADLQVGAHADIAVLNSDHNVMFGHTNDNIFDRWIFAGDNTVVKDVLVAGQPVVINGQHINQDEIETRYRTSMTSLLSEM